MEYVDQQTLETLSQYLIQTHSPDPELSHEAKHYLATKAPDIHTNFGLKLLGIIAEPYLDDEICRSAATYFKNHIITRWKPSTTATLLKPISDVEKEQIKDVIIQLMLFTSSPRVRIELSEGLALIGKNQGFCIKSWCSWVF
ncbi:hypothetical protein IFM89_033757 [Coptis chinensis]|uniref:Importin N-terminal domain-containing protein n=1 Tax=Coptis chinensis TaxID=261450 RepID=A0A835HRC6_9MAGN|nr:hypothetical protein IFM89_033757 [Coptis chinensis]